MLPLILLNASIQDKSKFIRAVHLKATETDLKCCTIQTNKTDKGEMSNESEKNETTMNIFIA